MNLIDQINNLQYFCNKFYNVKEPTQKIKYSPNTNNIYYNNKHNNIIFEKEDTLKTAFKYKDLNPLILILADENIPGGTWVSNCQEEVLFRRTALYAHLNKTYYPIKEDELLLAKNVGIFSLTEPIIDYNIKHSLDFVALPCVKSYNNQQHLREILRNKLRLLFNTCKEHSYSTIILGALGCGAFSCNPHSVADLMKEVINEYNSMTIIFSILGANYNIFKDHFNK